MLKSFHLVKDIHVLHISSYTGGFGTAWRISTKILSFLVGVPGGRKGVRLLCRRYYVCYLSVALWSQPRII